MRSACTIVLDAGEQATLEKWAKGRMTPARVVMRAKLVLLAATGMENKDIAVELGVGRDTVGQWRRRFSERRLPGLVKDAPRGGRKATRRDEVTRLIVERTTQTKPTNATHWSTRTLGEELGVSPSMIQRVWQANGLKPHRVKTFKVSSDKQFVEKMQDIVGLYLSPPNMHWCCARMRRARSKHWTVPSRACPSRRAVAAP